LGKNGVEALLPIGELSAYELTAMNDMLGTLKADITLGEEFVANAN
jgi:malate dehydrogenase